MTRVYRNDGPKDDELPSYDDVIREDASKAQTPQSASSSRLHTDRPQYVPPPNPRPRPSQSTRPNPNPRPPSGNLKPQLAPSPPQRPRLPWTYPRNFHCSKCNNTGYKIKNGRSCKSCWRRFAPVNNVNSLQASRISPFFGNSYSPAGYGMRPPMGMGGPPIMGNQQPMVVQPGDPRLGGVICGECRGTGRVTFLLDQDICPLCRGIGRIIT